MPLLNSGSEIAKNLPQGLGEKVLAEQITCDGIPTLWVDPKDLRESLSHLKSGVDQPFRTLYDLTAIDERVRTHRQGQPAADFTVVYHLLSYERNQDLRIKVPLKGERPSLQSITPIWPAANWYER
jgi:NADH-quinone oxidoreductase subunit C/D